MRKRMMRIRKRLFSWLLCGAVLISLCPQPALAVGVQGSGVATEESGLCEHHPDHTAGCGYSEGTPCGYVCEICNPQDNGEPGAVTEETQPVPPSNALALTPEQVQALIDALPTLEELQDMTREEQDAVYEKLQAANEAYEALTDEQKATVTGAELFDSLFDCFNGMVNALAEAVSYRYYENGQWKTGSVSDYTEVISQAYSEFWENGCMCLKQIRPSIAVSRLPVLSILF